MYKQGKYNYKSKYHYEKLLIRIILIFFICSLILIQLRNSTNFYIYIFTLTLSNIMIIHLIFRLMVSKGKIKKYIFNKL